MMLHLLISYYCNYYLSRYHTDYLNRTRAGYILAGYNLFIARFEALIHAHFQLKNKYVLGITALRDLGDRSTH